MTDGKLKELAFKNRDVAYAIIGQAMLDEGDIGLGCITIGYYSEGMARYVWEIANRWGLANPLREKRKKSGATVWSFSIKASKRKELYDKIGPLPDEEKDRAFRHLIIPQPSGKHRYKRGKAKGLILQLLEKKGPMTKRELMYELGIRGSTVGAHLLELKKKGMVIDTRSINGFGRRQSSKQWKITNFSLQVTP